MFHEVLADQKAKGRSSILNRQPFLSPQYFVQYSICVRVFTYKSDVNTSTLCRTALCSIFQSLSPVSPAWQVFTKRPKMILWWNEKWDNCDALCEVIEFSPHDMIRSCPLDVDNLWHSWFSFTQRRNCVRKSIWVRLFIWWEDMILSLTFVPLFQNISIVRKQKQTRG